MSEKLENSKDMMCEMEYHEGNKKTFNKKKIKKENNSKKVLKKIDLYLEDFENELITEKKIQGILDKENKSKMIDGKLLKEQIWGEGKKIAISSYEDFEKKINKTFIPILQSKFNAIDQNLKVLNKANIYDFLHSEGLSLNFWNEEEIESKRELLKKNNVENDAKRKLYSSCGELVKQNKIEEYNEYLEKMECVKIKKELENIRDANREFGKEIAEIEIKNFVDKFRDVVEEKIAREIFLKFFENNFEDDRKSKEINSMKRIKLSKKSIFSLAAIVIICILTVTFSWNQFNKEEAKKLLNRAEKYEKEGKIIGAKEWYEKATIKGNVEAMRKLGKLYYAEGNEEIAKKWYEKAIAKGDVEAIEYLGEFYDNEGDKEKAKEWYEKSALKGNAGAMNNLGLLYDNEGYKVKAKEWYEKAALKGNAGAMNNLGLLYYKEGDKEKAKELYEKSVAKGNADAMNNLGRLYDNEGYKVKAKEWYEKAVLKGNAGAMNNLGRLYDNEGDKEKAKEWYEKSAAKGDADAMYNLGVLYANEGDKEKAKELYEKSASKGDAYAMNNLGVLYENEGDKEKAKELYEKSASKGDAEAMYNLGEFYYKEGEKAKAKEWYEKASSKGIKEAKEALEKMKKNSK